MTLLLLWLDTYVGASHIPRRMPFVFPTHTRARLEIFTTKGRSAWKLGDIVVWLLLSVGRNQRARKRERRQRRTTRLVDTHTHTHTHLTIKSKSVSGLKWGEIFLLLELFVFIQHSRDRRQYEGMRKKGELDHDHAYQSRRATRKHNGHTISFA